ncbi:hypothetical protein NLJ89_g10890 [Agrocybe chaxingu]|uniref:Semialdehyde dehydrogenase NAD-binding domain-containing protein n=1 Tax=Agrocybe chaxingu TaxID=84603 RepID=A0A9W8JXB1_9AGAR|nr:hypothetical protein NLJ89_g10890 [Agrocybe chaxingu]
MARRAFGRVPGSSRGYATAAPTSTEPKRLGLIGARGYTGQALTTLLSGHPPPQPLARLLSPTRRFAARRDVENMEKEGVVDAWVMALPNGVCKPFVDAVDRGAKERGENASVVVDLGADYRFENDWTYGLPGCYATSTQLLLAPLVPYLKPGYLPTVFGVSGYSGAGTIMENDPATGKLVTKPKVSAESLKGGIKPYSLTGHIHEREAGHHLSTLLTSEAGPVKVAFVPSVAPWFSGIISTASVPLKEKNDSQGCGWVKDVAQLQDVEGEHGWTVGGFQMSVEGDRVVVVGGLDNLLKGAATQCLQNLNLALGYAEYAGIPTH